MQFIEILNLTIKNLLGSNNESLLLVPLIFGVAVPVKAGIYYYPSYQDGIEVRCKDCKPKHLVEITKSGRGMKSEGHGDDQCFKPSLGNSFRCFT